jgi:hypothetical protein
MKNRINVPNETELRINESVEGETIEMKLERVLANNDTIEDGAPLIYTKRSDGVIPEYDIRTDRLERMIEIKDMTQRDNITAAAEKRKKEAEEQSLQEAAGKNQKGEQEQG